VSAHAQRGRTHLKTAVRKVFSAFVPAEMAEKVGFDDFYLQNTAVEKFHPHYFVGEILDSGLFQQLQRDA
jgi:hypothetical protein